MIESIEISDVATYRGTPQILPGLSQFNYFFGSNGPGKTTIARVIADECAFERCGLTWEGGSDLQTLVYDRDWIGRNFDQSPHLKGVFTLGEGHLTTLRAIEEEKKKLDGLKEKRESLALSLLGEDGSGGKEGEMVTLEQELKDTCWAQKQKHDSCFAGPFTGLRNNAEAFKQKILSERNANTASLRPIEELQEKAKTVFGKAPVTQSLIPSVDQDPVTRHEANPILVKKVIGKEDVDIAAMIQRLENSDWVREGREFYELNEDVCPFCQQPTADGFEKSLSEYFDATFDADTKSIGSLESAYLTDSERIQAQVQGLIDDAPDTVDLENLQAVEARLGSRFSSNLQILKNKRKEPSRSVQLDPVSGVLTEVQDLIDSANALIREQNELVSNLEKERVLLTAQVWRYLLDVELKASLDLYDSKRAGLKKGIDAINTQVEAVKTEQRGAEREIRRQEKKVTSIQPTIDGINQLLTSFGFTGFSLSMTENETHYKIVRQDGQDAKETLSEGERSFVTFLYFFHLLNGSESESGITHDRVVVFDDPVSSLDAEVLFVVASLIKSVVEDVRSGAGLIKQVFVLTHNVYFHKEVTFNTKRRDKAMREETFWTVRKPESISKVQKHDNNPVSTCYEMLWAEVRNPDRSNLTIQNTLRRILENYFQILGGVNPDEICSKFDGKEKWICRSLFSWVNAGSHHAHDDVYVASDETGVEVYLSVFRAIFQKQGQENHYNMMMGIDPSDLEEGEGGGEQAIDR